MWSLKVGQVLASELTKSSLVNGRTILQHDERVWCFAPTFVGQTNDRDLLDGWMTQQHALDFHRRNVFAPADNYIFQTIANLNVAVGMNDGGVTGMKPAASHRLRGRFRIVVVTGHHHVA